jgi:two-component system chemotaxis sensor kinase CheA
MTDQDKATSADEWRARAIAAEKTVDVLKAKVMDLYNSEGQSIIHKQLDKARRRDEENARKRELMEVRNQELQNYSARLEAEVAARTNEVKTILNHVKFGFFLTDQDLVIGSEFSRSCITLFGTEQLAGRRFLDLVHLKGRQREHYRLGVDQVFEDILPPEVTLGQLPQRFHIDDKVLKVEGSEIRVDGKVDRLLFTVSDITDLEEAQRESSVNKSLVSILRQKDAFIDFLKEAKEIIRQSYAGVKKGGHKNLRRLLHTLKGNTASWGLQHIATLIHDIEEEKEFSREHISAIDAAFRRFVSEYQNIIGVSYDDVDDTAFEISSEHISHLRNIISDLETEEATKLRSWTAQVLQKPASALLGPIDEFIDRLAVRLGKNVQFTLEGADTLVDVEATKSIFQNLVHILRNAVDHGIEEPLERGNKGSTGHIHLQISREQDCYYLKVQDDGRGIDFAELKRIAVQHNLVDHETVSQWSDEEACQLIFYDGLSSAKETTEISGRGVGMSAIQAAVDKVFGQIHVSSSAMKGTEVEIVVPVPEVLRQPQSQVA